jgi:hypothetical protein
MAENAASLTVYRTVTGETCRQVANLVILGCPLLMNLVDSHI